MLKKLHVIHKYVNSCYAPHLNNVGLSGLLGGWWKALEIVAQWCWLCQLVSVEQPAPTVYDFWLWFNWPSADAFCLTIILQQKSLEKIRLELRVDIMYQVALIVWSNGRSIVSTTHKVVPHRWQITQHLCIPQATRWLGTGIHVPPAGRSNKRPVINLLILL